MSSPKISPHSPRCIQGPPTHTTYSRISMTRGDDLETRRRNWRIACGKATPEDLRKHRNHTILQWVYAGIVVLIVWQILSSIRPIGF
jgi:hypothetical protein